MEVTVRAPPCPDSRETGNRYGVPMITHRTALASAVAIGLLALTACSSSNAASGNEDYPIRLMLADSGSDTGFHPASGYAQAGVSPIYEALMQPEPTDGPDMLPTLTPVLAAGVPQPNADATEWTVQLRDNIVFSDGTTFDAADVKTTFDVARDPSTGSAVASMVDVIDRIEIVDDTTIRFLLTGPHGNFPARLTLPIAPSELVTQGTVDTSPLATSPVGTGPYSVTDNTGGTITLTSRDDYWGDTPQVTELVVTAISDDTARAQRVAAGELHGAAIPPHAGSWIGNSTSATVNVATTADWRGVSLPNTPLLETPEVRQAINLAADRDAMVEGPLSGYGSPLSTPLGEVYGQAHNPDADFTHNLDRARQLMDDAGWLMGDDGARHRDGHRAELLLMYPGHDTLRRDMAVEFASQMQQLGIDVTTQAGTWDEMTPRLNEVAVLLGGGEAPWDPDLVAYDQMHTRTATTGDYANPGNYGSPELDALLEEARTTLDDDTRNRLWRQAQDLWASNPSMVFLATVDHLYASADTQWDRGNMILEPHIHGATWGPWWNVETWTR